MLPQKKSKPPFGSLPANMNVGLLFWLLNPAVFSVLSPADGISCSTADNTANYGSGTPVSFVDDRSSCGTSYGTDDGTFSRFAHSLFLLRLSGSGRSSSCIY